MYSTQLCYASTNLRSFDKNDSITLKLYKSIKINNRYFHSLSTAMTTEVLLNVIKFNCITEEKLPHLQ